MSARLGARMAADGLAGRTPWIVGALGTLAVALFGLSERSREPAYAVDRTLLGVAFGAFVPLFCYALFEFSHKRERSSALVAALGRHGANRRSLALGLLATLAAISALVGAVTGSLATWTAHGAVDARLGADLFASLWSGALIGAAYAGLFGLGSSWGRRGRLVALVGDWLLGSGSGFFAAAWPRGHARSLLGGEPVLDASQAVAALALIVLAVVCPLVAVSRNPH